MNRTATRPAHITHVGGPHPLPDPVCGPLRTGRADAEGMKFTCTAGALAQAVATAALITPSSPEHPAYAGVQLEATARKLAVRGTDGATTVSASCRISDITPGTSLVPPKPLHVYLSRLDASTSIEVTAPTTSALEVRAADGEPYKFNALVAAFPTYVPSRRDKEAANLSELATAVALVRDSAGTLGGGTDPVVQVVSDADGVRLHATDQYRLARAELGAGSAFGTFDGLLPLRTLDLVASLAPTHVQLDSKGHEIVFHSDDVVVSARLAQDPFPTVDSVLRQARPHTITLDRTATLRAIRRLQALAPPGTTTRCTVAGDTLRLSVTHPTTGTGTEVVTLEDATSSEVELGLKFDYLKSAIATHRTDEVEMAWFGPLGPVFFTAAAPLPVTLVVMPSTLD